MPLCLGTQMLTALSAVTPASLTVPTGAVAADIQADGGTVRMRVDAGAPTATVGRRIYDGTILTIDSLLTDVRLLAQSGSTTNVQITYFDRVYIPPRRLGRNLRHRQTQIAQSIGAILASADFRAPLLTSLVPTRGTGAPTFTRATTAYVSDYEGVMRQVLSGEARFTGARRVQNLWGIQSAALAVAASNTMTLPAGSYIFSMGAGAGTATFSGTGGATGTLAAGGSRVSVLKSISAGTLIVTCSVATLTDLQVEDVTAQSIQTAGEYVSVGVLSSPYHGTGVDGVKCYDTTLAGVPIPTATLKGYLAEGARTNLCLQSQIFDNASWAPSGSVVTANQGAAPDGTTTADLWDGAGFFEQAIGVSNATTYTTSMYIKQGTGTTITIQSRSAVPTVYSSVGITFTAGVPAITSSTGTTTLTTVGNGWYRISCSAASQDTTSSYRVRNGNGTFLLWGAQVELGSFASSYIPTTTVAVTRNADVLTYPNAGNVLGTVGTCYTEVRFPNGASSTQPPRIITANSAAERNLLYVSGILGGGGRLATYDGTGTTEIDTVDIGGALNKVAASWGGSEATVAIGGLSNSGTFDGDFNVNELRIGNLFAAGYELNGNIADVCIWTRKLPDAILKRVTT